MHGGWWAGQVARGGDSVYPCIVCNEVGVSFQNLRVRTVKGAGMALSFGKLPGSLSSKYMLVDGEKVMFGSYR